MKIEDWDLIGELIAATKDQTFSPPTPIQAGIGLTKTMAPPSEEVTKRIPFPEVPTFPSFYENFFEVIRHHAEPFVKNEEVRKVMALIDQVLSNEREAAEVHLLESV